MAELEAKKLEQEARRLEFEIEAKKLAVRRLALEEKKFLADEQARKDRLDFEREIELAKLQTAKEIAEIQSHSVQPQQIFDVVQWFTAVPKFRENQVEDFFVSFEKMADRLKWPSEYWTTLLQHVLVGKGRRVYNQIGREESADYEYVKEAILRAYEQVPEAYRQKFIIRSYTKVSSQTYAEFAHAKQRLLFSGVML